MLKVKFEKTSCKRMAKKRGEKIEQSSDCKNFAFVPDL